KPLLSPHPSIPATHGQSKGQSLLFFTILLRFSVSPRRLSRFARLPSYHVPPQALKSSYLPHSPGGDWVRPSQPSPGPQRPAGVRMPINPVHFAHGVCDEFLRYLFSAFPLSDPDLRDQFRRLLDRPSSLDIPLVNGPFVSLSEAFAKGDPVQELADKRVLHH